MILRYVALGGAAAGWLLGAALTCWTAMALEVTPAWVIPAALTALMVAKAGQWFGGRLAMSMVAWLALRPMRQALRKAGR